MTRGEVYELRADRRARGHEQRGTRLAVVVQSDWLSQLSTVIVAPTSTSAGSREFRPEISVRGTRTRVMVDQLRAVDPNRLGRLRERLDAEELNSLNRAVKLTLGLLP